MTSLQIVGPTTQQHIHPISLYLYTAVQNICNGQSGTLVTLSNQYPDRLRGHCDGAILSDYT